MKRNDLITKLIAEGFSVETLASFTDKQLIMLTKKILNEQVTLGASAPTSPATQIVNVKGGTPAEKALKAQGKSFIAYEEEMAEGEKWIQKAFNKIDKKGTEGKCTGDKFGGPGCPEGSKAYNMAKNLRKINKEEESPAKKEKLILSGKKTEVKETAKVPVITPGKKPAKKGYSITSKDEIMEMIRAKLNEQKTKK